MRKPDDSSLTPDQYAQIRAEANRLLVNADAMGRFPTPIQDVMAAAQVEEVPEDVLNDGFLAGLRKKAGATLKRALSKVIGLFDARSRLIFIDHSIHAAKKAFVRLHEIGHGFIRWQRDLYAVVEDCEQTLDYETAELFEREANVFAAEVMFQLDSFSTEADQSAFGILVPVKLSKKYGASIYSAIRRYVERNHRACAVLVLDPPELLNGFGFRCNLRRVITSSRFREMIGPIRWQEYFTPDDRIGAMVPIGRKMSGRRSLILRDMNGDHRQCFAEAFTQSHQVFILIHAAETLTPRIIPYSEI